MMLLEFLKRKNLTIMTPIVILGVIMMLFIVLQYEQLNTRYVTPYDEGFIKPKLEKCNFTEIIQYRAPLKLTILCSSNELFGNPRILEFVLVVGIFPLVYLITRKITQNDYAGLVSCGVLLSDRIFSLQSFTIYGSSEWLFFFLVALYCMYKNQYLIGVFLLLSFASKGMMLMFVPVMMLWLWKIDIPKRARIIGLASMSVAVIVTLSITFLLGEQLLQKISINFDSESIDKLLTGMLYVFKDDTNYLLLIMPVSIIGLAIARKNKISMVILIFILTFYSSVIILPMLSSYNMFDYRMTPMIILSVIGIGIFASCLVYHDPITGKVRLIKKQLVLIFLLIIVGFFISSIAFKQIDNVFMNEIGLPISVKSTWSFDPTRNDVFMQKVSDNCNAIIVYDAGTREFRGLVGCNPNANDVEISKTQDTIRAIMNQLGSQNPIP